MVFASERCALAGTGRESFRGGFENLAQQVCLLIRGQAPQQMLPDRAQHGNLAGGLIDIAQLHFVRAFPGLIGYAVHGLFGGIRRRQSLRRQAKPKTPPNTPGDFFRHRLRGQVVGSDIVSGIAHIGESLFLGGLSILASLFSNGAPE